MGNKGKAPKTMKALVAYDKDRYVFEAKYPVRNVGPMISSLKQRPVGSVREI